MALFNGGIIMIYDVRKQHLKMNAVLSAKIYLFAWVNVHVIEDGNIETNILNFLVHEYDA